MNPSYVYTLTVSREMSSRASLFIETFGSMRDSKYPESYFDLGFSYNILNNLQLDSSGGFALNSASADLFLSLGISLRLPH